jgi:hypothetical protein
MFSPFRRLFFSAKLDMFMASKKVELSLIKGDHELPAVMVDGMELERSLI